MAFTKKEQSLLKDMQNEEKLCAEKYRRAAENAHDAKLKHIFEKLEQAEQNHYDTVTQMLDGKVPSPQNKAQTPRPRSQKELKAHTNRAQKQSDTYLVSDLLATEKYVAGVYNTAVFEFNGPAARQVLRAIQQVEQNHGRELAEYMQANGMQC